MATWPGGTAGTRTAHIPSLDGIRALAVLAVIGFHFGLGWLQGGFFGVDVFYVLSGFLITTLLLAEARHRGTIGLGAFWLRRARRLLPCLALVLIAVSLCVRFLAPAGTYPGYRTDALSALFYFSNWWQIHAAGNYFVATGAVSPLTHTWSLAVEEQFYLVWPIVVLAVLRCCRSYGRAVRVLLAVSVAGAAASAVEMALLYRAGASTTRLYFGTDTHAQCVLVGAALACTMARTARHLPAGAAFPAAATPAARRVLGVVGLAGLGGVAALSLTLNGSSPLTYQGGFALCALAAAGLVAAAACLRDGPLVRFLSLRPLVLLGTVSYGVYLWHFPVDVFVTGSRVGLSGPALMALQFALTVGVATASFVVVERPVMAGTFWRSVRASFPAAAGLGATVAVIFATSVVPASATAPASHFRSPRPGRVAPTGTVAALWPSAPEGPPPPRVAVLGDSTAGVLEVALIATAPRGTTVVQGAIAGCGLAVAAYSSDHAPTRQAAMFPGCNESQPASQLWPARDAATVAGLGPGDVVLFLAGMWETQDLLRHGQWTDILRPSFRHYELGQLRRLVGLATAHGAHLDLLTMAAMERHGEFGHTGVMDTGPPNPASTPRRRAAYNGLLRQVAREHPGTVSVLDFGRLLSPGGRFTEFLDGVQVRATDGVHTPAYEQGNNMWTDTTPPVAGAFYRWLSPRLWPAVDASAHAVPPPGSAGAAGAAGSAGSPAGAAHLSATGS
ncbi:MAG: acyltransferase family protein [Acidimicrobiales bacterium]